MSELSLIIFDLDGTLIDSRRDIADCVNWTLQEMDLDPIPHEHIYQYVGHGVRTLIEGAVGEAHGHDYDSAMKIFDRHYTAHLLDHTRLYPGMAEVLQQWQHTPMAVITNKPQRYTDPIIDGLKLRKCFAAVLGREACPEMKPHPQPILHLMEQIGAAEKQTLIIGDTEVDIEAGRRAGIKTCGVLFGFGRAEKVKAAEPDYLVNRPEDLLDLKL